MPAIIVVRGAGDLASGVALRLYRAGLNVVMTELAAPVAVRRTVAFAEAVYDGHSRVEEAEGSAVHDPTDTLSILGVLSKRQIPVVIDPDCTVAGSLHPLCIVDGRMTKHPPEAMAHQALVYIGLGPGFVAPTNCHAAVETARGHSLGRVFWDGAPLEDTAVPAGDPRRILRAPAAGILQSQSQIGQHFRTGDPIASIDQRTIAAPFDGILRGILRPGTAAIAGMKIGDLDARGDPRVCELVSDKSLAVGGGVLEALLAQPAVRNKLWA